ncbi:hypothetical protein RQP46_002961 [Phenoliferia psychrophenolica]
MLHMSTVNWTISFAHLLSASDWTQAFNMVALDSRLHGKTTGDDVDVGSYSLEDLADDTIAALRVLNLGPIALIGDSWMGATQAAFVAI